MFARYFADETILNNETYTRPDLKPFPAMVKEPAEYDQDTYTQLLQKNYMRYRKSFESKKSPLYRLLNPVEADWEPKANTFINKDPLTNYDYKTGNFPTTQNPYADHRY